MKILFKPPQASTSISKSRLLIDIIYSLTHLHTVLRNWFTLSSRWITFALNNLVSGETELRFRCDIEIKSGR